MKFFKNFLGKKPDHSLPVAFKYKGHRFYAFESASDLIKQRQLIWAVKSHQIGLSVTHSDLLDICETGIKAHNEGRHDQVAALLNFLQANLLMHNSLKNMLSLASAVILIDDEPIEGPKPKHSALKEALLEESEGVRDFFLGRAISCLKEFGNITQDLTKQDLLNPEAMEIESQLLKLINSSIYKDLSKV